MRSEVLLQCFTSAHTLILLGSQGHQIPGGNDIRSDMYAYHADLAYIGHEPPLKPDLTPRENLHFWVGVRRAACLTTLLSNRARIEMARLHVLPEWTGEGEGLLGHLRRNRAPTEPGNPSCCDAGLLSRAEDATTRHPNT